MKANEGVADRLIRFVLGAALIAIAFLFLSLMDGAVWGIAAAGVGAVLVVTSFVGFCPAYKVCGISTNAPENAPGA